MKSAPKGEGIDDRVGGVTNPSFASSHTKSFRSWSPKPCALQLKDGERLYTRILTEPSHALGQSRSQRRLLGGERPRRG